MDSSELAMKMLEWEKLRKQLDVIEAEIRGAVLELGKTQTVGNVRASYSGGRSTYDYQSVGREAPLNMIIKHTKTVTDWKAVCDALGEKPVLVSKSEPGVTIKLV